MTCDLFPLLLSHTYEKVLATFKEYFPSLSTRSTWNCGKSFTDWEKFNFLHYNSFIYHISSAMSQHFSFQIFVLHPGTHVFIDFLGEYLILIKLWFIMMQIWESPAAATTYAQILGRGVLKFGFGWDVPSRNLKVDPYKYWFFKKKWPIHIPFGPILGSILSKLTRFFPNFIKFEPILAQIRENFEKIDRFID